MRKLLSLAVVLAALAGSQATAPVPKDPPPPTIDGKYTLVSVSNQAQAAVVNPKGGPGRVTPVNSLLGPVVITKKEIVIEGRATATATGFGVGAPTTMEYALDPTKTPMTIDVETTDLRGHKAKSLGLIETRGNRLILAVAKEGEDRPKTTDEAAGVTVYYFLKAPPPPRSEYRIVAMTAGREEEAEKELNKLAEAGYELVNTTNPVATNDKAAPTTIHFVLKRTVKHP